MEIIIGAVIGIAGIIIALLGIWYAHKSYAIAKRSGMPINLTQ
jgi:hypothetical protein